MKCYINISVNRKVQNGLLVILFIVSGLIFQCCSGKDEPEIPAQLSVNLIASDVTAFRGTDGSIESEVSGGSSPYNYLWSNGETTKDIANLPSGFYSVVIGFFIKTK